MQKVFFNWQHLPALFKLFLEEKIINGTISFGFLRSPAHNGKVLETNFFKFSIGSISLLLLYIGY